MSDNQERMIHGRVIQHASLCKKKTIPLQSAVGETLFASEELSSRVHVSPKSSSQIHASLLSQKSLVPQKRLMPHMLLCLMVF